MALKEVGPFPASKKPLRDRPGLYKRISRKTGARVWAWWDGFTWYLYSTSKKRALKEYSNRCASRLPLQWIGASRV